MKTLDEESSNLAKLPTAVYEQVKEVPQPSDGNVLYTSTLQFGKSYKDWWTELVSNPFIMLQTFLFRL